MYSSPRLGMKKTNEVFLMWQVISCCRRRGCSRSSEFLIIPPVLPVGPQVMMSWSLSFPNWSSVSMDTRGSSRLSHSPRPPYASGNDHPNAPPRLTDLERALHHRLYMMNKIWQHQLRNSVIEDDILRFVVFPTLSWVKKVALLIDLFTFTVFQFVQGFQDSPLQNQATHEGGPSRLAVRRWAHSRVTGWWVSSPIRYVPRQQWLYSELHVPESTSLPRQRWLHLLILLIVVQDGTGSGVSWRRRELHVPDCICVPQQRKLDMGLHVFFRHDLVQEGSRRRFSSALSERLIPVESNCRKAWRACALFVWRAPQGLLCDCGRASPEDLVLPEIGLHPYIDHSRWVTGPLTLDSMLCAVGGNNLVTSSGNEYGKGVNRSRKEVVIIIRDHFHRRFLNWNNLLSFFSPDPLLFFPLSFPFAFFRRRKNSCKFQGHACSWCR